MSRKAIGEVCHILNGYSFKSSEYKESGIRIIRITNVQKGSLIDDEPKYYSEDKLSEIEKYMLEENDILISLTGNVGRVTLVEKEFMPCALNQRVGCLRIKDSDEILNKYLYYYLMSEKFENDCINSAQGVAQKNMSTEWLKKYEIEVPELDVQKKIVEELDTYTEAINNRKEQINDCRTLINSMINKLESKTTNRICLSDLIIKEKCTEEIADEKVWLLNLDMIEKGTGKIIDYNYISREEANGSIARFDTNDILYSKLRPYLNKVVLADRPGYATTELVRIKVDENKCNKYFLFRALLNENFVAYISNKTTGAKMPRTNMAEFWKYEMPLPDLNKQNEFEKFYKKVGKIEKMLLEEIDDLKNLLQEKIEKYFI